MLVMSVSVRESAHAVLEVEAVAPSDLRFVGDLAGDGLGRADVAARRRVRLSCWNDSLVGIRESAGLCRRRRDDLEVVRPELLAGLLVGCGDVPGRVHADRLLGEPEPGQGLAEQAGERGESLRGATDDGQHQREPVPRGADDRFGAAADADPGWDRPGLGDAATTELVVRAPDGSCPSQVTGPLLAAARRTG